MVADIDAARRHVHICTYIWLADHNGLKLKDACIRAAKRGIDVRILADALGSMRLIRSTHWRDMEDAGCSARVALPVGNPLWTFIRGRVDLRNHRKLMVIDNAITWCGSQNFADPEFRIKPRYAPWVDVMTRWAGPVAKHMQFLFVSDWMAEHGEDLSFLLAGEAPRVQRENIVAQVVGTGTGSGLQGSTLNVGSGDVVILYVWHASSKTFDVYCNGRKATLDCSSASGLSGAATAKIGELFQSAGRGHPPHQ